MTRSCTDSAIGQQQVIKLNGWLDKSTSPAWEKRFETVIAGKPARLVIDCTRLEYVSSPGFRLLMKISRQITGNHGRVGFYGMEEHIREVVEISGLDDCFPVKEPSNGRFSNGVDAWAANG